MWKWIVIALSLAGVVAGITLTVANSKTAAVSPPRQEPVRKPFPRAIVGAGLVEPESESIVIGVAEPGWVMKVFVARGQTVKANDPLFQIDTRGLEADKHQAEAALATAQAELTRIRAYRRPEDELVLRAKLADATATAAQMRSAGAQAQATITDNEWNVKDHEANLKRLEATVKAHASPQEDLEREQFAVNMAQAKLVAARAAAEAAQGQVQAADARVKLAEADLKTYLDGPWPPDIAMAQAQVDEAQAKVAGLSTQIERRIARAPRAGTVLRCNLHEGEYAGTGLLSAEDAPIVLGDLSRLRVRVDIDEFDAGRFRPGAPAVAFFKGQAAPSFRLDFVEVEPFVIPKRALTNSQQELVDARVLQVIYRFADATVPVHVGQQLDVFVEENATRESTEAGTQRR